MKIYIDLTTSKLIQSPTLFPLEVTQLNFKRETTSPLNIQFVQNGVTVPVDNSAVGSFEVKETGKYDAAALISVSPWTITGSGVATTYSFSFSFAIPAIDTLFEVDNDPSNDVAILTLMGEIQWVIGQTVNKTSTIVIVVDNDVVRSGDVFP